MEDIFMRASIVGITIGVWIVLILGFMAITGHYCV